MKNNEEISGIKESINGFVGALERLKAILGKSMDADSWLQTKAPVVNALHEVQVCAGQNIECAVEAGYGATRSVGRAND